HKKGARHFAPRPHYRPGRLLLRGGRALELVPFAGHVGDQAVLREVEQAVVHRGTIHARLGRDVVHRFDRLRDAGVNLARVGINPGTEGGPLDRLAVGFLRGLRGGGRFLGGGGGLLVGFRFRRGLRFALGGGFLGGGRSGLFGLRFCLGLGFRFLRLGFRGGLRLRLRILDDFDLLLGRLGGANGGQQFLAAGVGFVDLGLVNLFRVVDYFQ